MVNISLAIVKRKHVIFFSNSCLGTYNSLYLNLNLCKLSLMLQHSSINLCLHFLIYATMRGDEAVF